jgi:hypothetical protein
MADDYRYRNRRTGPRLTASFLPGSRYRTDKPGPVERCDAHVMGTNDDAGPERSDCRSFLPDS